jgi:hypothetical protein
LVTPIHHPLRAATEQEIPLCVDLDGTLLNGDCASVKAANTFHCEILILAAAGILCSRRTLLAQWTPLTIYLLIAIGTGLIHLVLEVQPRFHHALLPLLAILAARHLIKTPAAAQSE